MSEGAERVVEAGRTIQCVVFDFGGGTCDVSVLEITADNKTKQILMSQIAVSRYHRLGGGDLDAAIVHEHLIPELLKENGLGPLDLTWAEKKRGLEPQLLGTAEALKEALCREIDRMKKFGKYDEADKKEVMARQPGITLYSGKRSFHLARPTLTAAQWESILAPFLDKDLLYGRQTEFRLTQSILAPLQDALDRACRKAEEIDFCLMVGSSSLIPLVREAVEAYFQKSAVGLFQDPLAIQLSVARGAAWHSLYKAMMGQNLIRPILHDALALVTTGEELYPLVPGQTPLPYPAKDAWARVELVVPPHEDLFIDKVDMGIAHAFETTDFNVEAVDLLGNRISCDAGIALVVAIYSALKKHSASPALLILGDLSIQGNIKGVLSLSEPLQVGMDNGARRALIPIENKRHFLEVPADIVERVDPIFYGDPLTAAIKALGMN